MEKKKGTDSGFFLNHFHVTIKIWICIFQLLISHILFFYFEIMSLDYQVVFISKQLSLVAKTKYLNVWNKVMLNFTNRCIHMICQLTFIYFYFHWCLNIFFFPVFLFVTLHCIVVFFNPFAYLFDKTLRRCWKDVFNKLMFTDFIVMIYFFRHNVILRSLLFRSMLYL